MGIFSWIIIGLLAGFIASKIAGTDKNQGFVGDLIVGIIGAFIGGLIFNLIGGDGVTGLNLWSLLVATLGAVVLLLILRSFRKPMA